MKSFIGRAALVALSCALSGGMMVGCSSGDNEPSSISGESAGKVGLNLEIADGINVDTVHWVVTQGGVTVLEGDIPVSDPGATISLLVGGLPPGDYNIALTATSTDGEVTCLGDADFTVLANQTVAAHVDLECSSTDDDGEVRVDASVTECTLNVIETYTAAPLVTSTGGSIELTSTALDVDGLQPDFLWSSTGGSITSPTSPDAVFNCDGDAGTHTLTLTVSSEANTNIPGQDPVSCEDSVSFTVECVALSCGNGVIDASETCDDGALNGSAGACPADCTAPVCGDGDLEGDEVCDDNNAINTDNCPNDCSPQVCDDGTVEGSEECEPANTATCDASCQSIIPAVCGDGVIEGSEQCEPPNTATCDASCQSIAAAVCGDGVVSGSETCEPAQSGNCDSQCTDLSTATCLSCEQANPDVAPFVDPDNICNFYSESDLALEGPAVGTSRRDLCWEMIECIRNTECAENGSIKCYCGSSGDCSAPNGDCKTVVERSLESTSFSSIAVRFDDFTFGGAGALTLGNLDSQFCKTQCYTDPAKPLAQ
jgi:cysteine-rich repeat protein